MKAEAIKVGDVVRGPSIGHPKVRTWRVLAVSGDIAAGQNVRATRPYRHLLRVGEVEPVPPPAKEAR